MGFLDRGCPKPHHTDLLGIQHILKLILSEIFRAFRAIQMAMEWDSKWHQVSYRWQRSSRENLFFLDLDLAARNFELKCETWSNMTYFSKHIRWQNSMLNIFSEDSPIRSFDQIAQMHDRKSIWGIPTGTWADFLSNVIDSSPVHVAKYPSQISGAGTSGNHIYLTR